MFVPKRWLRIPVQPSQYECLLLTRNMLNTQFSPQIPSVFVIWQVHSKEKDCLWNYNTNRLWMRLWRTSSGINYLIGTTSNINDFAVLNKVRSLSNFGDLSNVIVCPWQKCNTDSMTTLGMWHLFQTSHETHLGQVSFTSRAFVQLNRT